LAIIFGVPLTQISIQLSRGERVQFTDVFRYAPTESYLRQFEQGLKDNSWFEQKLRPFTQQLLFRAVGDTGSKADMGRNGWLFFRPDVRYDIEADGPDAGGIAGAWVDPPEGTRQDSVVRAIVRFRNQLKGRGIELLVLPVPGKPSVYPEMLGGTAWGKGKDFRSPTLSLIGKLRREGIEVVDLFTVFHEIRKEVPAADLYLARDTHWTPEGAKLAAKAVAQRLRSLGWVPQPTTDFRTRKVRVRRYGDVLEMIEARSSRRISAGEDVECEQVMGDSGRLLVSSDSERPGTYRYPGGVVPILAMGDSFSRIYQEREPRSLGGLVSPPWEAEGGSSQEDKIPTRLLPGSAGFLSQLAFSLRAPLDFIVSDGGASTDVRRSLATNPEILEGKKVVVWEFVERDIQLGKAGWLDVPLPPTLGANIGNGT
jgi:hypothetical protein